MMLSDIEMELFNTRPLARLCVISTLLYVTGV